MTGADGFEFVEGPTADLCFVARGASLEAVFEAAAAALLAATLEDAPALGEAEVLAVSLEEPDLELLLLRFLNELVFLRDARGLLLRPRALAVRQDAGVARLEAELAGEHLDPTRHRLASEVKAATAHGLELAPEDGGYRARVTLDV